MTKLKVARILVPTAVVVKQTVEETTKSGIVLAKEALEGGSMEMHEGEVIAVGCEVLKVKVGDYVSFGRHSYSIKKWDGVEYFYLYEDALHTIHEEVKEDYKPSEDEFIVGEVI